MVVVKSPDPIVMPSLGNMTDNIETMVAITVVLIDV